MRTYGPLSPAYWFICDADDVRIVQLKFHIERGDYFPFLATIFGMLEESTRLCNSPSEIVDIQTAFVENLRKDLLYLHEHYTITPRAEKLAFTKKKMVRFDA